MQLDGIIWEEDSIAYGCENATLVLNNQKGLLRKNYPCLESGHYQTPDGKDTPWPVCTTKPTDPCELTFVYPIRPLQNIQGTLWVGGKTTEYLLRNNDVRTLNSIFDLGVRGLPFSTYADFSAFLTPLPPLYAFWAKS